MKVYPTISVTLCNARGSRSKFHNGYCQSGQMMSAACLLAQKANPTDDDIDDAMSANLCRCGTYPRIRKAIHRATEIGAQKGAPR